MFRYALHEYFVCRQPTTTQIGSVSLVRLSQIWSEDIFVDFKHYPLATSGSDIGWMKQKEDRNVSPMYTDYWKVRVGMSKGSVVTFVFVEMLKQGSSVLFQNQV
jgi:hypothetical protein